MLKSLFRKRPKFARAEHEILRRIDARLTRVDRLVTRLQRDVERVKLHTGIVLEPTRALALLASGQRIYVDPRDRGGGVNLLSDGKYEEDEVAVLRRYLRPGSKVLDIGANYGIYSISVAPYIRPGGRVIGFEPNPHVHDLFSGSIYINGLADVVEARRLGVHDTNGSLRFLIDETGPGGAHIVSPDAGVPDGLRAIDVPVVRLDDHLPSDLVVDVIKIDVEGHEEEALRGMRELIARSPDVVILMELFYTFFPSDEVYVRFIRFITEDLGLTISQVGVQGVLTPASADSLRGTTGCVLLSKQVPAPRPDLTIYPEQLHLGQGVELVENEVRWSGGKEHTSVSMIAHGPYVYLPKGYYRLNIDADFGGEFVCSVLENSGDTIGEHRVPAGKGFETEFAAVFDAPLFEIAIWSTTVDAGSLRFRKAELWRIG